MICVFGVVFPSFTTVYSTIPVGQFSTPSAVSLSTISSGVQEFEQSPLNNFRLTELMSEARGASCEIAVLSCRCSKTP